MIFADFFYWHCVYYDGMQHIVYMKNLPPFLEQPPYIPTIAGVDDTSNFDEFEAEEVQPTFGGKTPMKKAFSGKNLPFVGFTFMKSETE